MLPDILGFSIVHNANGLSVDIEVSLNDYTIILKKGKSKTPFVLTSDNYHTLVSLSDRIKNIIHSVEFANSSTKEENVLTTVEDAVTTTPF